MNKPNHATLDIDTQGEPGSISPMLYGHFLEHIYNSVDEGLDSQMIRNPAFAEEDATDWPGVEPARGLWESHPEWIKVHWQGWNDPESLLLADREVSGDFEFECELEAWVQFDGMAFAQCGRGERWQRFGLTTAPEPMWRWGAVPLEKDDGMLSGEIAPEALAAERWRVGLRRAEGRLVALLNGEEVAACADPFGGEPVRVGIGTRVSSAKLFGAKLASGGQALWNLSPAEYAARAACAWKADGDAVSIGWTDDDDPRKYQQLRGGSIAQDGLAIEAGRTYECEVSLRGWAEGATAALTVGDWREEHALAVGEDWGEQTVTFGPAGDSGDGRLEIRAGDGSGVQVRLCTLRPAGEPFRPCIMEMIERLRPTFIRWPGGCFAERYRWMHGVGKPHERRSTPNNMWGGFETYLFGTDEFIALCRRVGAEPLIVLNMGQYQDPGERQLWIDEALAWIEYCNGGPDTKWGARRAGHGHPEPYGVHLWELDNEAWQLGPSEYAARAHVFAEAIRQADPEAKILACGAGSYDPAWNETLIKEGANAFDLLSVHHYKEADYAEEIEDARRTYVGSLVQAGEWIAESANPAARVAVTEWNQMSVTLRGGIYAAMLLNQMEKHGELVTMACPALWLRHLRHDGWNNAFINHDGRRAFMAPNGQVMAGYREHLAAQRLASALPEPLDGIVTRMDSGELVIKLVNPEEQAAFTLALKVDGRACTQPAGSMQQLTGEHLETANTLDEPDRVAFRPVELTDTIELPPLSVTIIRLDVERSQWA